MAVSETVSLPAQPTVGSSVFRPLGGNGYTAPQSMFIVDSFQTDGDGSGGLHSMLINSDVRFECVLAAVSINYVGSSTDAPLVCTVKTQNVTGVTYRANFTLVNQAIGSNQARGLWTPPPIFGMTQLTVQTNNVDGDDMTVSAVIYNFNRRASELVSLDKLLSSIPSAGNFVSS